MPEETDRCRLRTLAVAPRCSIEVCDHGLVHLNFPSCTVRLHAHDLYAMAHALAEATRTLSDSDEPPPGRRLC